MSGRTSIQWTDATWNPVRGCSKVSEGCRNCYAMLVGARFSGPGQAYEGLARRTKAGPQWTGKVQLVERRLHDPLRWRKGRRIFVNSMSDLFHEALADEQIDRVFAVMALAPQHTFQILTKRPERMRDFVIGAPARVLETAHNLATEHGWGNPSFTWPLPNLWLGTSTEDQPTADERIPFLLQTPAAVRCISAEPLLGPIELSVPGRDFLMPGDMDATRLDWVIVGGESGPGARPMDVAWARAIVAECRAAGVAVFVKQLGALPVMPDTEWLADEVRDVPLLSARGSQKLEGSGLVVLAQGDRKGGEWDWWPADLRVREFPTSVEATA